MIGEPLHSSQGSQYEKHKISYIQGNIRFSPQKSRDDRDVLSSGAKPKKPPTVTPNRFTRFFTPRNSLSNRGARQSKAGRQLRDITKNGVNRRLGALPPADVPLACDENVLSSSRPIKRRKLSIDFASSPPQSSPLKHVQKSGNIQDSPSSPPGSEEETLPDLYEHVLPVPQPIRRLQEQSHSQRILRRSLGDHGTLIRGWKRFDHCANWRAETAGFVSTPADMHAFHGTALPFCTASCNTNSLIAIGDEEGGIRLVDSSPLSDFTKAYVSFRPHRNAVMDIAFSSNDYQLATASGDQTARIVDMHTQRTMCILSGHGSSVKQVSFRPNDDNLITTSSRDGLVMVWDLRCAAKGAVQNLRTSFARVATADEDWEPAIRYAKDIVRVGYAHRSAKESLKSLNSEESTVSITAIKHLLHGREHLLLTASELNSSVKLWDLRNLARRHATPVSSTPLPETHNKTRNFGINAMLLSGDGARLYTLCRDATIYAYSTTHLVLGSAPVFSSATSKRRTPKDSKNAVGPIHAFRHAQLRTGSFYVKAALRHLREDKSEMIAVGSSDGASVVFPTDERHLQLQGQQADSEVEIYEDEIELPTMPPKLAQTCASLSNKSTLPIHNQGSGLITAHSKEVTSLTWAHDGELVTISDDYTARCWREDSRKARQLRRCGEGGGQRWNCGWADVDSEWDGEDGE